MTIKKPFVYADLNSLKSDGFLPWITNEDDLRYLDTKYPGGEPGPMYKNLKFAYPDIKEGDVVFLWTDNINENDKYDPLVYEGTFAKGYDHSDNRACFGFKINESEIEPLSQSKKFLDYPLKEVMGQDYEIEKKAHPEWF